MAALGFSRAEIKQTKKLSNNRFGKIKLTFKGSCVVQAP
jgi:hypothetical protein